MTRDWRLIAALLPIMVLMGGVFALPCLYLLRMSFNRHTDTRMVVPDLTLDNYARLIAEPFYLEILGKTLALSLATAVATVLVAYALCLVIWSARGGSRLALIGLALVPLMVSEIAVIIGWRLALPKTGFLPWALSAGGPAADRIGMLYTWGAALVGTVYITLPYAVFVILGVVERIDPRLFEASRDLGASPLRTFRTVTLPLTRGAVQVALAQTFVFTMGAYATPQALGPDTLWTIGFEVQRQMATWRDWPFAAALAVVLIALIAAVVWATQSGRSSAGRFHG
jgi:ABC-type spermidine/putrescine transport system permease subunit I